MKKDTLAESLEKSVYAEKSDDDYINDGKAMERLSLNPDFKRYEAMLSEAYAALVRRIKLAGINDLPSIQGAIIQHEVIMSLPKKITDIAVRMINNRRDKEVVDE